jgi:hypothetical protein
MDQDNGGHRRLTHHPGQARQYKLHQLEVSPTDSNLAKVGLRGQYSSGANGQTLSGCYFTGDPTLGGSIEGRPTVALQTGQPRKVTVRAGLRKRAAASIDAFHRRTGFFAWVL